MDASSPRLTATNPAPFLFFVGDCIAAALTGVATTLAVRLVVFPDLDMVVAMMLGMAVGTVIHLLLCLVLGPFLGMFETMVPGMFIGMHGGMLFGMRDSMQHAVPLQTAIWVGAAFGVVVAVGVHLWSLQLRRASEAAEP